MRSTSKPGHNMTHLPLLSYRLPSLFSSSLLSLSFLKFPAAAASERLQALDQIHLLKEQSEGTTSTTTTTTTTRSTTTTTSAPTIPPASFELPYHALAQSSFESARKQVIEEPASVSLNEIDSSDPPKVKPTKQKKKKSKTKKSRRKHHHRRQSSTSTTTSTTEFPINSSTFSLLEESMLT